MQNNLIFTYNNPPISVGNVYRDKFSTSKITNTTKPKYKILYGIFKRLEEVTSCALIVTTSHNYGQGDVFTLKPSHIENAGIKKDFITSYIVFTKNNENPLVRVGYDEFCNHCSCGTYLLCGSVNKHCMKKITKFVNKGTISSFRKTQFHNEFNLPNEIFTTLISRLNI